MDGEIRSASKRLRDRGNAASIGRPEHLTPDGAESLKAAARAMFSGLDIDMAELNDVAAARADLVILAATLEGGTLRDLVSGVVAEGIAIGLLIAEARERAEARS